MESVYDTEMEEILRKSEISSVVRDIEYEGIDSTEIDEIASKTVGTVVYNITTTETETDNTQLADITTCLIVIILAIGVACGVVLGKILWGRFK